jgi:hypothetical protein
VGSQLRESELLAVEEACKEASIPLVAVQAYGLMGSLRVSARAGFNSLWLTIWERGSRVYFCFTKPGRQEGTGCVSVCQRGMLVEEVVLADGHDVAASPGDVMRM